MTPELLERMRRATDTIVARWGRPVKTPVSVPVNANDTFTLSEGRPLIIHQGDIWMTLSQATEGVGIVNGITPADCLVYMERADALAFCDALDANAGPVAIHYNSCVLRVADGKLAIGVGPGYVGDASGNLDYGGTIYGPVPLSADARAALSRAIRALAA